ncbi:type I-E CRISPR-associated protein Cas6/Cse3/CasE [Dickeya zeae]|jgi:CRISPR system Cascade subunit CasE|uniref:type I-E CRISPR-associated protein Cas6/Cse3/CasE n=1 Tax=Dickeya zeae TaxID=204042 RepID=UPI0003A922B6|nr:type I-E CRISPR-associated protein Cas6/Cse3/CasE [Dickeya zeae]AUQ23910.1 type I-E CRISPR-associated protein Cas6/Cse3/CasE [Dickeya zeae]UJR57039.1 type I-E CRISPR-associated protein Cas6/Cse3/CasE [Dickeya zeae]UJR63342.1 type I-E CRISPR-associated protein Cas6/Cse3/CasE [Dickeya zeae]
MFFSRVTLQPAALPSAMAEKWLTSPVYASHQWLWQLFPHEQQRRFLFRQDSHADVSRYYLLSACAPRQDHNLFEVETKPWQPQLNAGMQLAFSLRANPVVTRQKKRSDVLMDAKYQAKAQGADAAEIWPRQQQAATDWLVRQGEQWGFEVNACRVDGYQRQRWYKPQQTEPVSFSSVDFDGLLRITDAERFAQAVSEGLGKSRALGCGLLLLRRA